MSDAWYTSSILVSILRVRVVIVGSRMEKQSILRHSFPSKWPLLAMFLGWFVFAQAHSIRCNSWEISDLLNLPKLLTTVSWVSEGGFKKSNESGRNISHIVCRKLCKSDSQSTYATHESQMSKNRWHDLAPSKERIQNWVPCFEYSWKSVYGVIKHALNHLGSADYCISTNRRSSYCYPINGSVSCCCLEAEPSPKIRTQLNRNWITCVAYSLLSHCQGQSLAKCIGVAAIHAIAWNTSTSEWYFNYALEPNFELSNVVAP